MCFDQNIIKNLLFFIFAIKENIPRGFVKKNKDKNLFEINNTYNQEF